jgi:large subunit ribosomal protein L2
MAEWSKAPVLKTGVPPGYRGFESHSVCMDNSFCCVLMKLTRYRALPSLRTGHNGHSFAGRNNQGRITVRHRGGGHARSVRTLDWQRTKGVGRVIGFSYDPRRSARLATVLHQQGPNGVDSNYSYIIAAAGRSLFQTVNGISTSADVRTTPTRPGDQVLVGNCEPGDLLHAVEPHPHHGPRFARAAGTFVQVRAVTPAAAAGLKEGRVTVRLPSGVERLIPAHSRATIGGVATSPSGTRQLSGKAGRSRWLGRRPTVRGVARNPVDHPHGGNTAGGRPSVTFRSWPTKGQPTRSPRRHNRFHLLVKNKELCLVPVGSHPISLQFVVRQSTRSVRFLALLISR